MWRCWVKAKGDGGGNGDAGSCDRARVQCVEEGDEDDRLAATVSSGLKEVVRQEESSTFLDQTGKERIEGGGWSRWSQMVEAMVARAGGSALGQWKGLQCLRKVERETRIGRREKSNGSVV
ncbi:hypothetical protein S245_018138 [Arachis hypogaea]